MKRRIVAMMLAVVVVASVITGCGAKNDVATSIMTEESVAADTAPEEYVCYEELPATSESYVSEAATDAATGAEYESNSYDMNATSASKEYASDEAYDMARSESYKQAVNSADGETYKENKENGFFQSVNNPLSTFAADVDTASYSNFRRFINEGYDLYSIPSDAIRTEEMVNYFKYDYKEPAKGEVFGVNAQVSGCPWNRDNLLMTIGVNTATLNSQDVPDCNIVFLVDVSGSMKSDNKLPLIQKSMAMLVDSFDENDRISIVTYASGVDTVLEGCHGNESRKIIKAFEKLRAGGSTNGGDGIKLAYKVADENFIEGGVNRVIICSDGDFNVGLTSEEELEKLISKKKDSGIFLSTLGFGMGNYSDTTMETLADKGNGNYAYIDDLTEAKRVLVDEMTSTFVTVAKDVKFQVEFNPAVVAEYRLVGYENRVMNAKDFKDDTKDGGEMGAGHQVTAIYELVLAGNSDTELKYQNNNSLSSKGAKGDEYCTMSIAYKEADGNKSQYKEYPINTKNYTVNPDNNFRLASAVAQASLALRDSEFLVDLNRGEAIESAISIINTLQRNNDDEYVAEFENLLEQSLGNGAYYDDDYMWYED